MPHEITPLHPFSATLLHWYAHHRRELPWRGIADPYAIWVSEIILQQTRIAQGTDYWHRFMRRFPTVEALAQADDDEVMRQWQGLGYYSRARNLHAAAKQIVARGRFPDSLSDIRALKGVGDYTAAAVASMAFGIDAAAVDGNVYRVLARHFDIDTPINTGKGKRIFTQLAQTLLPHGRAADFNQAMMDFGALLCTPKNAQCHACPLQESCEARRGNIVDQRPVKLKKLHIRQRRFSYIFLLQRDAIAMHRRGEGDIWQGLWEPILIEGEQFNMEQQLKSLKLNPENCRITHLGPTVKHVLTHQVIHADAFAVTISTEPNASIEPHLPEGFRWLTPDETESLPNPRLVQIFLRRMTQDNL